MYTNSTHQDFLRVFNSQFLTSTLINLSASDLNKRNIEDKFQEMKSLEESLTEKKRFKARKKIQEIMFY